jgi:hypothetical protein
MDVEIAEERIFTLTDRFTLDHAEGRAWSRRADAFGTVARLGGLLNRSASEDYECVYRERRLQPFWRLHATAVAAYERTRSYTVAVSPSVRNVRLLGEEVRAEQGQLRLSGVETCRDETSRERLFDGLTKAENPNLASYLKFAGAETDAETLATAAREGTVVVPPENKASMLVREVV